MTFSPADWTTLAPGLIVVITGLLAVAVDLFLPRGGSKLPLVALSYAGLGAATWRLYEYGMAGGQTVSGFGGLLVLDGLTMMVSYAVLAATALLLLSSDVDIRRRHIAFGEYYGLVLLSAGGMMLLAGSNDFLMVFLNLEILSLALYVLTGITRRNPRTNEAAMKYFVTGAFATGFLLLGITMIYGATGQLRFDAIGDALAKGPVSPLVGTGLALVLVGFAFKIGAVPFHMWVPDVYEGAPTTTTAFMAVTVKAAGVGALVRILLEVAPGQAGMWSGLLWGMSVATMIVGNLLAAQQTSVKRMLAWSSVAHTGYVLVALASMVGTDGKFSTAPASAAVFYVFAYSFMTMGAFQFLVYLGHEAEVPGHPPEWQDAEQLDDLAGLGRRRPWAAAAMTLFLVSLGGFPPTAGFVGKLFLFQAAVKQGHVALAVIGVLASLVSLYYYLRVVVWMYMNEPVVEDERPSPWVGAVVAASAALTMLLGLLPDAVWYLATASIRGFAG